MNRATGKHQLITSVAAGARVVRKVPLRVWQWTLALCLLLVIAHQGAKLFWLLLPLPTAGPSQLSIPTSSMAAAPATPIDIDQLKSLQLFGDAQTQQSAAEFELPQLAFNAEDTKLALQLQGVVASSDQAAARAFIAHQGKQQIYANGDKLPGGASVKLAQVLADRAILNNGGRYETLWLYEEGEAPRSAPVTNPRTQQQAAKPSVYRNIQQGVAASGYPTTVTRQDAAKVKQLSDVVRVVVARDGDQVLGYRVRPGRERQLFKQLGFQNQDIITAVNGISLQGNNNVMAVYEQMRNARSAHLEIVRGGETVTLDVSLEDDNG